VKKLKRLCVSCKGGSAILPDELALVARGWEFGAFQVAIEPREDGDVRRRREEPQLSRDKLVRPVNGNDVPSPVYGRSSWSHGESVSSKQTVFFKQARETKNAMVATMISGWKIEIGEPRGSRAPQE
jgi:hypothetical protein